MGQRLASILFFSTSGDSSRQAQSSGASSPRQWRRLTKSLLTALSPRTASSPPCPISPVSPLIFPGWRSILFPPSSQCRGPSLVSLGQGGQTHFHQGPPQPCSCLQRADIILGLHKCNCSLTRGKELYIWPLKANVAPGENEFDTPSLGEGSKVG